MNRDGVFSLMPNSDRSLIVAGILGLASITFGAGLVLGGDWTGRPYEQTGKPHASVQRYETKKRDADFIPYPVPESNRCYDAKEHDSADLCAQWRAAIAAENSAQAAKWANLISVMSAVFNAMAFFALIRSLSQTDKALAEARRSANYAGESHFAFMRVEDAYLVLSFGDGLLPFPGDTHTELSFYVSIRNIGRSAAVVTHIQTTAGGFIIVDGLPVPADGKAVRYSRRLPMRGVKGVGQTFSGEVHYYTAIGGAQSFDFTATTMQGPSSSSDVNAMVVRNELAPRFKG